MRPAHNAELDQLLSGDLLARSTLRVHGSEREAPASQRCVVLRHGGYGDMLMAASTFPHLKDEGWHLTLYTGRKGAEILKADPNIDRIVTLDISAWQPSDLRKACAHFRATAARFVDFNETLEGLLLADPIRPNFWWPHAMREKYMSGNYLEAAHDAAGVVHDYRQRFHDTREERHAAVGWRKGMRRLVVLAVSGSDVSKQWPHAAEYCARLVEQDASVHVLALGDLRGAKLPSHARVHAVGTQWQMRMACAVAKQADLVIGQETGLLNAVAMERTPKVVLLSHSSAKNLTKHWQNVFSLAGSPACYPCHRRHVDWRGCRRDPITNAAACQAGIAASAALQISLRCLAS